MTQESIRRTKLCVTKLTEEFIGERCKRMSVTIYNAN